MILEGALIGVVGGLVGVFYRNCLKVKNMIFNPLYFGLRKLVNKGGFFKFISYPLGYCIYCSTTWITFLLCLIFITNMHTEASWQDLVLFISTSSAVQHIVVCISCRFIISNHPDLSNTI